MRRMARRFAPIVLLWLAFVSRPTTAQEKPPSPPLAGDRLAALDRISSDSLKGHLSFLASDLLEGRDTPSRGLDLAASYIAAQFRRAGLEPIGDDGYFQTATYDYSEATRESVSFEVVEGGTTIRLDPDEITLADARTFRVEDAGLYKIDFKAYETLDPGPLASKALLVTLPARRGDEGEADAAGASIAAFAEWAWRARAAAIIIVRRRGGPPRGHGISFLRDPKVAETEVQRARRESLARLPLITVQDPRVIKLFDAHPFGPIPAKLAAGVGQSARRPVKLRNVAGLLRGSDPSLRDTYVLVTAHYDHIGNRGPDGADRIYNGANDDGSGTASVIEIASSLATLKERPRRSILFVAFFGEERGLLGSRYYGRNPLVPVDRTIADVNLEQVGRTDDTEGPRVASAALTGFGYSDVSRAFVAAGEAEGVTVVKHPRNSDLYFNRSDNQALADLGVPAHTLCVAFAFPDYHGLADHWDKLDYANMARVDRMVARTLLTLADDPEEPKWDESNPRAARYLKAWRDRRGR